jgi:hypothetical protein
MEAKGRPGSMNTPITHHKGKGSSQEILPSRSALSKLVRGPQTTINDYAKASPNVVQSGPNIEGKEP